MSTPVAFEGERLDATCMPDLTVDAVRALQHEGYARIGRAFALVTMEGQILTGLHRDDGRNGHPKKGLVGPISETVAGQVTDNGVLTRVEGMRQTFTRCLLEELSIRPNDIPLFHGHDHPAPSSVWPIDAQRNLFAQTAVLFLGPTFDPEQFAQEFTPTLELESIAFMGIEELLTKKLRNGAANWATALDTQGFLKPSIPLVKATLPAPRPESLYVDLRLDTMHSL